MLAGTGLGDDAFLTHALGKDGLTKGIVNLMSTGMEQIFTLQENLCLAVMLRELLGIVEHGRTTCILLQDTLEVSDKLRVILVPIISLFQFVQDRHYRLRYILSAVLTKSFSCHFISPTFYD